MGAVQTVVVLFIPSWRITGDSMRQYKLLHQLIRLCLVLLFLGVNSFVAVPQADDLRSHLEGSDQAVCCVTVDDADHYGQHPTVLGHASFSVPVIPTAYLYHEKAVFKITFLLPPTSGTRGPPA